MAEENAINAVREGLTSDPRYIPAWFAYDKLGVDLFKKVQNYKDYYPERCAMEVLTTYAKDICDMVRGQSPVLIDIGCGDGSKATPLLDAMIQVTPKDQPVKYVPNDVNEHAVIKAGSDIKERYGDAVHITPLAGKIQDQNGCVREISGSKICSVINLMAMLSRAEQLDVIQGIKEVIGTNGVALLSFDTTLDQEVLDKAYNNSTCFNIPRNTLTRLNTEYNGDMPIDKFEIEMNFVRDDAKDSSSYVTYHAVASEDVTATIGSLGVKLDLKKGEKIRISESEAFSRKYSEEQVRELVRMSGLQLVECFQDGAKRYLVAAVRNKQQC